MEIRHGPSSIAIEGDRIEGLKHVKRARKLIQSLKERAKLGGIETLCGQLRIPGSSAHIYAVASPAGDKAVIVVQDRDDGQDESELQSLIGFPDALSGIVRTGLMTQTAAQNFTVPFRPTSFCASQFNLPFPEHANARIAVPPDSSMVDAFGEPPSSAHRFSQHVHCKSSWYSGLMAKVVQFLLGVGYAADPGVFGESADEADDPDAQLKEGIATRGLRVKYDFRFMRCHGVTLDADDKPWLVEISASRGVLMMPLPVFEQTTTSEFREIVESQSDSYSLSVLDDFGGFPTGETIPAAGDALDQAIGSGIVIRALESSAVSGFYEHSAYGTAMGWSFRPDGRYAHNTAWRFGLDLIQRGVHYGIRIEPGAVASDTFSYTEAHIELASLFVDLINGTVGRWQSLKIYRLQTEDLSRLLAAARAGGAAKQAAWDELGTMQFPPIASVSAGISKVSEGKLWWSNRVGPNIHFPDVFLRGNLKHSFLPAIVGTQFIGRCDTVMHVCHTNGVLDTVRYFYDSAIAPTVVEDGFESCMLIGTFTRTTKSGGGTVGATFYSTQLDNREERWGIETTNEVSGKYVGVSNISIADDLSFPPRGLLARTHRFQTRGRLHIIRDARAMAAVAVPYYCRDGYYHAAARVVSSEDETTVWAYQHFGDPWTYETWRNLAGWTGFSNGSLYIRGEHPDGCGQVDARTVTSNHFYNPYLCSEYVDFGSWAQTCDDADAMRYGLPVPQSPESVASNKPAYATLVATLVRPNGEPIQVQTRSTDGVAWQSPWFQDEPYTAFAMASAYSDKVIYQPQPGGTLRFLIPQNFDPVIQTNFVGGV